MSPRYLKLAGAGALVLGTAAVLSAMNFHIPSDRPPGYRSPVPGARNESRDSPPIRRERPRVERAEPAYTTEAQAPALAEPPSTTPVQAPAPEDPIAKYRTDHRIRNPFWSVSRTLFDEATRDYKSLSERDRTSVDEALKIVGNSVPHLDASPEAERTIYRGLLDAYRDPAFADLTDEQRNDRLFSVFMSQETGLNESQQKIVTDYRALLFPKHDLERRMRENAEKHAKER